MIETEELSRSFGNTQVLKNITLKIEEGSFTAVLGRNGSGKSTLARHFNAVLIPSTGRVKVDEYDTSDEKLVYTVRELVGMVFQNPESQAVAAIVEDDTAFAPENLGLSDKRICEQVDYALKSVGIEHLKRSAINTLSGGQKQLCAIAGIIAMNPKYMVFDEGSSMLDPAARKRVLSCVKHLQTELNITVIWITHYMEEAAEADRMIIIENGTIKADDTPKKIFQNIDLINNSGLEMPKSTELAIKLNEAGLNITPLPINPQECAAAIADAIKRKGGTL